MPCPLLSQASAQLGPTGGCRVLLGGVFFFSLSSTPTLPIWLCLVLFLPLLKASAQEEGRGFGPLSLHPTVLACKL